MRSQSLGLSMSVEGAADVLAETARVPRCPGWPCAFFSVTVAHGEQVHLHWLRGARWCHSISCELPVGSAARAVAAAVPEGADAIYGHDARAVKLMVNDACVKKHAAAFAKDGYRSSLLPAELRMVLEPLADDYLVFGECVKLLVFSCCEREPPSSGDIKRYHSVLAGRRLVPFTQFLVVHPEAPQIPLSQVLGPLDQYMPLGTGNVCIIIDGGERPNPYTLRSSHADIVRQCAAARIAAAHGPLRAVRAITYCTRYRHATHKKGGRPHPDCEGACVAVCVRCFNPPHVGEVCARCPPASAR